MHRCHFTALALLLACGTTGGSNPHPGETTNFDATDGEDTDGASGSPTSSDATGAATAGPTTGASEDSGSESGSDSDTGDTGIDPPLPEGICNDDGECAFPETCSTCPDECGSCDIEDLDDQRAKYVDQACATAGDGLVDSCAASNGAPGRFNELQVALDSLEPGDTLYVHPGDYFRPGEPFRVHGVGTANAPIVVTAANPDDPPTIHSWDPSDPTNNAASHAALVGAEEPIAHVIIDHLRIEGLLSLHGDHTRVQYVECTHGWEGCDGNWSCIRFGWCTDCTAHHNWVHDVFDTTNHCNGDYDPREAGLKEFDGVRTVWEFNTVENTERWGYDLHRSSVDSIARFNLFQNAGSSVSIRMNRTGNQSAYGNVVIGGGTCIQLVPEDAGDGFADVVDHNTCLHAQIGVSLSPFAPATVTHNVFGGMAPGGTETVNIVVPDAEDGTPHFIDHNAYDATSYWVTYMYDSPYAHSLEDWQESTDYDDRSIAAEGGACTFVDPPTDADDTDFDLTIADGPCATLSDESGPVGACAVTACVGHDCRGCGF